MTRTTIAATATLLAAALAGTPAAGQTVGVGTSCSELATQYDQARNTAHTLVMDLTSQVLGSGGTPDVLSKLGISPGNVSPEQAVRKGAVSAMPPNAQTAVLIYLLQANTTMQEMIWKGCKPPGQSGSQSGG